jgi:protein TonB
VTPENPIPRRVYSVPAPYPQELQGSGYGAAVEVRVLVDASGVPAVMDERRSVALSQANPDWLAARAGIAPGTPAANLEAGRAQLQGLVAQQQAAKEAFLKSVLESIRQWRYDAPAEAPIEFSVSVLFGPDPNGVVTQSADPRGVSAVNGGVAVGTFSTNGNPVDAAGRVASPALAELDRQQLELMKLRGDLVLRFSPQDPNVRSVDAQIQTLAARRAALVAELQKSTAVPAGPLRVGGNIKPPTKTRHVDPAYPPEAQANQVSGVVILDVTIDDAGHVADTRILRSVPLLDAAAIDAVKQWEFVPTLLNGKPVAITMTVTVQFSLNN